jgi:hypothetical protein
VFSDPGEFPSFRPISCLAFQYPLFDLSPIFGPSLADLFLAGSSLRLWIAGATAVRGR